MSTTSPPNSPPPRDIEERILAFLSQTQRPVSTRTLARRLGVPRQQLTSALERLRSEGRVVFLPGRGWRLGSKTPVPPAAPQVPPIEILRRLCRFYADVVRETSSSYLAFTHDDERLRQELRHPVAWARFRHGPIDIPRSSLPLQSVSSSERVVFCGPLHLTEATSRRRADSSPRWLPILLLHATCERHRDSVRFTPDGYVEPNLEWLDLFFPASDIDAREDFLIQIGLLEDRPGGDVRPIRERDLQYIWQALPRALRDYPWYGSPLPTDRPTPIDLTDQQRPGIYSRVLVVQEELSSFVRGLHADLRNIADADPEELRKTALFSLFCDTSANQPSDRTGAPRPVIAQHQALNPDQRLAIEQTFSQPLTVVQGPPGTGKSSVVRSLLLTMGVNSRSAVFASRNHRAVDTVVRTLNPHATEAPLLVADVREQHWPEILRHNSSAATAQSHASSAAYPVDDGIDESSSDTTLEDLRNELVRHSSRADACADEVASVLDLADDLAAAEARVRELREKRPDWVTIVESAPGPLPRRPSFLRRPTQQLSRWDPCRLLRFLRLLALRTRLRGRFRTNAIRTLQDVHGFLEVVEALSERHAIEQSARAKRHPRELIEEWFDACSLVVDRTRSAMPDLPRLWLDDARKRHPRHIAQVLAELRRYPRLNRRSIQRLSEVFARHKDVVLTSLPVWAVSTLRAHSRLPRVAAAFDLAVIDEAAQCDVASVLPILFRARRALFIGDPLQLPPVGSLGAARLEELRRRHRLEDPCHTTSTAAGTSAWELARDVLVSRGGGITVLREHYRCDPRIAEYFSKQFYGGRLLPRTTPLTDQELPSGIRWTHVAGGYQSEHGSRWHPPLVDAVIRELEGLHARAFHGTVGVVTPFRAQANRIRDAAHRVLDPSTLRQWQFLSDTVDGFQGGERDVVLFALVGGGEGPDPTPRFYIRDLRRFNVAVSRARILLHVFGDRHWASASNVPALLHLVEAADRNREVYRPETRRDLIGPVWEPRLADDLRRAGIEFVQQYPACGFYLDFAIFREDGASLNVEVDGEQFHRDRTGGRRAADLRRDLILKSNGWHIERFWVYELRDDIGSCLKRIRNWLEGRAPARIRQSQRNCQPPGDSSSRCAFSVQRRSQGK